MDDHVCVDEYADITASESGTTVAGRCGSMGTIGEIKHLRAKAVSYRCRIVTGTIINDDDLVRSMGGCRKGGQRPAQFMRTVVHGDNDGQT